MRVLIIGSGGGQHALAWKIGQSPLVKALFVAPGNGGTEKVATNLHIDINDHAAVIAAAQQNQVDFVIVGPDAQVVAGLGDDVRAAGITCFCPSAAAGQLEGSKGFTKQLCDEYNIPTAAYARFEDEAAALAHVYMEGAPIVIKADGLAAGKGVTVAMSVEEAEEAVIDCFSGAFGASGAAVVIEEFMEGEEVSLFVLCDGTEILPLTTAQDHKRAFEGDTGPNTGGMGAYSPAPVMSRVVFDDVMRTIIEPTVRGMAERGTPFQGVLFAGLMLTEEGPKLVEYNARFGDPECQVMMMRMESDLVPLLHAVATGTLKGHDVQWKDAFALTVVMAADGYPGPYDKNSEIHGAEGLDNDTLMVFHAGTRRDGDRLLANGGRVLNVTAIGNSVTEAQSRVYAGIDQIDWPQGFCRRDIGWRELMRERN